MLKFVPNFFSLYEKNREKIINTIFPPNCIICGKLNKNWICENCKKRIEKHERFKLIKGQDSICRFLNWNDEIFFDEILYCYKYEGIVRNMILKYKFSDSSYMSNFFAKMILNNKKINEIFKKYDIIIPVPMDKIKKAKRGYNQTELITNIIDKNLKYLNGKKEICIEKNCIIKNKITKTQSTLKSFERRKNVEDAFFIKQINKIKGKKIILFDDVCTTGATVNEISRKLKLAGAEKIFVLVIAKD